ncbi:amidohydrolase family protein [Horticoccus luteus]|uniref:Amidohydrolase family protein n=1 Tax=Horticoccus luteus TaxID=2862869 RepID=A0A8F9XGW7_9BACT|nr:amidohydrolase family protein [Horticoccus luteus]QYM78685.1 amidohydrolase family protein [Horticoccus luteus]
MPNFPIVDTHLHIWNLDRLRYPWLAGVPMLNRNHLIDEYRRVCGPVQVAKMVFLQCEADFAQFQEEADWVTEMAAIDPRIRGIVPWAPLEKGDAAEADLARLAANPLIKGIRRIIQFEADQAFCLQPDFVRGVQLLPRHGLSFDLCVNHRQLANTIKLVRQCPNVSFVLDHIGKPDIKAGLLDPWRAELRELAAFPNVVCKMSGLVTEADFQKWTAADLRPYIDHVMDCFGFDRVMFGGDWPVASQATDYPRWVQTLDDALAGASPDECHKLYVRNAEAFYRV